jgi:predicted ATPase
VTKQNLIGAVWPDTFVGDAVLKVAIRQIREALSDDPKSPRFIETAHRRGYRFIGDIEADTAAAATPHAVVPAPGTADATLLHRAGVRAGFVGRQHALSRLHEWFGQVRSGEPKIVFVTGEAGIGKTTLVDTFTETIGLDPTVRICGGQCLEQYGMGEAYLPVLDAIRKLCRHDAQVVDVLRAHAPMWLMEMPALLTASDRETFKREGGRTTRERMLREMGEALDALTAHAPLTLVLEDLHWSDFSTLDLISYMARRRRRAHLMVVATYRPAELIPSGHPLKNLKRDLLGRQLCEELPLEYLDEDAVAQHLAARFPGHRPPLELATLIHERSEGNPLFMVHTIDHLIAERLIEADEDGWRLTAPIGTVKVGVPDSIRQLIEAQIDRLDESDQRILEAASVAGLGFQLPAVSAALDDETLDIEGRCEALSRHHQFIRECRAHTLPNGQAVGRFAFVHAVYRHVLYERVSASRRMHLHRRIGERAETVYGERAHEIAAELAMHFEQATDYRRAARYLQQAAVNATRRSAYLEAIALSRRGLELLATVPDTDERARQELWLQITLGVPLIATEGYAAPEVGSVYRRARRLCERLDTTPEIAQVLWGLWTFHTLKAELSTALEIATEFPRLAEHVAYPGITMRGHWATEITYTHQGKFVLALEHFEKALSMYDPSADDGAFADALNPGVALRGFAGWSLWFVGKPERALIPIQEALALARHVAEPHGIAHALAFAAVLYQLRREPSKALHHADEAIALSTQHGLLLYEAMARVVRGWALIGDGAHREAAEEIRQGLIAWHDTGAQLLRPHFLALLAEAHEQASSEETARILDDAIGAAESTEERCYEAELYRLKGEHLFRHGRQRRVADAEACFQRSLGIAREQEAHSLELRATLSLARLHRANGRGGLAHDLLRPVYERFEEGFDTPDLRDARDLLNLQSTR